MILACQAQAITKTEHNQPGRMANLHNVPTTITPKKRVAYSRMVALWKYFISALIYCSGGGIRTHVFTSYEPVLEPLQSPRINDKKSPAIIMKKRPAHAA